MAIRVPGHERTGSNGLYASWKRLLKLSRGLGLEWTGLDWTESQIRNEDPVQGCCSRQGSRGEVVTGQQSVGIGGWTSSTEWGPASDSRQKGPLVADSLKLDHHHMQEQLSITPSVLSPSRTALSARIRYFVPFA